MDVSFIVPIYNTEERLLLRCFNSILKLKDIKYEVLLIDDGSEDFVEEFCKQFISEYSMFHYLKKSNEGVSQARNYGINRAKGKYLFFIDSDDAIVPEVFNRSLFDNRYDIIIFDLALVDKSKLIVWHSLEGRSRNIDSKDAILTMMYSSSLNSPCTKLIKRELVIRNKIYFDKNIIVGEDAHFILSLFLLSPQIYYNSKIIYHYFRIDESSRRRRIINPKKIIENIEEHKLREIGILDNLEIDCNIKENVRTAIISNGIKDIFNLALDFQDEKLLSDLLKEKIIKVIKNIDISILVKCNLPTKIRYYIIDKEMWGLMAKIQYIRRIYLKLRGLHI